MHPHVRLSLSLSFGFRGSEPHNKSLYDPKFGLNLLKLIYVFFTSYYKIYISILTGQVTIKIEPKPNMNPDWFHQNRS
jgi:hypothetical protein